jgi:hypothetical protein
LIFASANDGLLATGLYYRKNIYLQLHFLDTVTDDAKVLLKEACSRIHLKSNPQLVTMTTPNGQQQNHVDEFPFSHFFFGFLVFWVFWWNWGLNQG